ncbi:MAG: SsrA-binding protein SmpB [Alphaproteobacteria bacterium]|nr:SsrA-binding protein SmpB [Alphaproteobacteria bacterium]
MAAAEPDGHRIAAQNRKARHDYFIDETIEAGIVLFGSEVKSLRLGKGSITESYATARDGDIYLLNAHIAEYSGAHHFGHETRRPRKLLLHKRERDRLVGAIRREGMTLVPLSLYFNQRGRAKVALGLARGKKKFDKRDSIKERDWQRRKAKLMRERG